MLATDSADATAPAVNTRPRCFFDISIGDEPEGRIVMELYNDITPKTVENFIALCKGDPTESGTIIASSDSGSRVGQPRCYRGSIFHRVIQSFMLQGGDFTNFNGTGGECIWGEKFNDENFEVKHDKPFLLSMANAGPNTNGSQFFITCVPTPHLDGKHVVFGEVVSGFNIVRYVEHMEKGANDKPTQDVKITDCGVLDPATAKTTETTTTATSMETPMFPVDYTGSQDPVDIVGLVTALKTAGNVAFKTGQWKQASRHYDTALRYLDEFIPTVLPRDAATTNAAFNLWVACRLNLGQSLLKMKQHARAVSALDALLDTLGHRWTWHESNPVTTETETVAAEKEKGKEKEEPQHWLKLSDLDKIKAHFRRGVALAAMNDVDNSLMDFKAAARLDGGKDAAIRTALTETQAKAKKMYGRMFGL